MATLKVTQRFKLHPGLIGSIAHQDVYTGTDEEIQQKWDDIRAHLRKHNDCRNQYEFELDIVFDDDRNWRISSLKG